MINKKTKVVSSSNVYIRFSNILKLEDYPKYSFNEFKLILDNLFKVGFLILKGTALLTKSDTGVGENGNDYMVRKDFIKTIKACNNGDLVVNIKFELDDIAFSLKDDIFWVKYSYKD